jgi:hypothetical protein
MTRRLFSWKLLFPGIVVVAVLAVVAAFVIVRSNESEESGNELHEALDHNPGLLNNRQLPIAYVAEKLGQGKEGGEASGEILNGPSQELYDARAYPRHYIAPAQRINNAKAFTTASARASTAAGQAALKKAEGTSTAQGWTEMGPRGGVQASQTTYTGTRALVSGRATALAISHPCTITRCVLYLGTAGGGVWKTKNALAARPQWDSIGTDIPSTAIGSLYLAPNGDLYVGTGEGNGSSDNEAGVGLYMSTNAGASFTHVSTMADGKDFTQDRSIASFVVDPNDPQHMYLGTAVARHGASSVNGGRFTPPGAAKVGLYESTDGGATWSMSLSEDTDTVIPHSPNGSDFFRGGISKVRFDPTHPGTVYAAMFDYGLYRRVGSGDWKAIYTIHNPGSEVTTSSSRIEFALAHLHNGNTRIYLGDATYFDDTTAGLLRTDNATTASPTWTSLSDPTDGTPGYGSYNFCQNAQCYYDMVVTTPPGHPNTVFLSGSMNYDELLAFGGPGNSNGRAVVRSTDAGVHFTDMTDDAQPNPNGLHPDQHALVFAPGSGGNIFFTASDGGIVQQKGPFVDDTALCAKRGLSGAQLADCMQFLSAVPTENNNQINQGLATLQFQSVSSSNNARILQGGTQDNGTWENDRIQGWVETVGGDGGQSAFDPKTTSIRYHSYYAPQYDVNFHNGNPNGWDWISDPLLGSGEPASFYPPMIADVKNPGTAYVGMQHIWRTTDHGGNEAYLQKHCNELTGDFSRPCGDWQPMGGDHGDLASTYWGRRTDTGNYVVAVERAPSDNSTLWAATRYGRLFVSTNANAADPSAVTYQRIDHVLNLPVRFISGISIDPANPNHAYVSYSGYSAYRAGGHVYDVTWDPSTGKGTARDISYDLGDQPVTDIVYAPITKALFASTDFGVLTLAAGDKSWMATQGLPSVAVYGMTLSPSTKKLLAATHGRGIWELPAR